MKTFTMPESNYYIGCDNGISGSCGVIEVRGAVIKSSFYPTPVIKCLSYTKEPQHIHRIDWRTWVEWLPKTGIVLIERPMVNPKTFKATQSALRSLEATIIIMEMLNLEYHFIDSKEWQREFLSSSVIGHEDMKKASMEVALKLHPNNGITIKKHKDGDGLLIAEYCYRKYGK